MAIVYGHRRKDTNALFYIGVGSTLERAYCRRGRNQHWNGVANKYGYSVEIIADGLSYEDALKMEMELIQHYGRRDLGTGELVNLTEGGRGGIGVVFTPERRQKISDAHRGRSRGPMPEEQKRKISEVKKLTGCNRGKLIGRPRSEETKQKISEALKKKEVPILTDEERNKLSLSYAKHIYEKYTLEGQLVETYLSLRLALISLGVDKKGKIRKNTTILNVVNNPNRSAGGYRWKQIKL